MVGGALKKYFEKKPNYGLFLYDKGKGIGSIEEVLKADFIYVCVPTPYKEGVGCDTSIVEEVVGQIKGEKIIIIKSTVEPGTTDRLQKKYPQHRFLFNPEFLTEQTADQDMGYPDRQIVGYTKESYTVAKDVIQQLPLAPFERIVPAFMAEFVKYGGNTWFATKVAKNNEFYDLFRKFGGSDEEFEEMISCMAADKRIGRTHLKVVHKGYRGYGSIKDGVSACLPKDTRALLDFGKKLGVDMPVLAATDEYNEKLWDKGRKEYLKNHGDNKKV
uniref:Putative UDP-glucose/GDP-mannose dehydrogenasese n=1 Tax=viral metagenome TaxID=1070528 RepID=A0A6M3MCN6_9ZZZZ